jgi:hypothetical protein
MGKKNQPAVNCCWNNDYWIQRVSYCIGKVGRNS